MNDEEIMRRFKETFSDEPVEIQQKKDEVVSPYRAMTNQNVVPTSMNVPTSSNNGIPPLNNNVSNNQTEVKTEVNNQEIKQNIMNVDSNNYNISNNNVNNEQPSNVNYNYVPTYESKKKKTISIKITPELKPVIVIVIILFVVIMIIPIVYEFFTHLR